MRLHLLDATYELFRAHFGYPHRPSPTGQEVGAVIGLIETTLRLLRDDSVTHLGAAFDTEITSFRNDLFDGYKTGEGLEPELWAQFPLAERALESLGVVVWRMSEFEADDALATAAMRWCEDVGQVVILSPDKDLAQCVVGDRVVTFDRRQEVMLDETGVVEKFGVAPESIPDYLALVGDPADGIPGVAGWGAKSTAAVLAHYHRLEAIPRDAGRWEIEVRGAARLAANLAAADDVVGLYRQLATLRRDVPLTEELADLVWIGVRREEFSALCDELGVTGLRERPHRWV